MAEPRVLRDLRVLRPEPRGFVVYGDPPISYKIRSVADLKRKELHEVFGFYPDSGETEDLEAQHARMAKQIKILCPDIADAILDEMTFRECAGLYAECLGIGPIPLVESLAILLKNRTLPCEESCEHPDCPALRELWALKEKLTDANPTAPAPGSPASGGSLTASGSLTT